ncbi:MAG: hypothetical protein LBQ39_06845 [Tannerellaceae bacterium]|nr:hypothetical protein [Tannerellaceae bacterium]
MKTKRETKQLFGMGVVFVLLLGSCLAESSQKLRVGNQPGVVETASNDSVFIHMRDYKVYASKFSGNVENGDCGLVNFDIDFGSPENADSGKIKGFRTVSVIKFDTVPRHTLLTAAALELTDSSIVVPNEQLVSSLEQRNTLVGDVYFLFSVHSRQDSLPLHFNLSYNPDYAPPRNEQNQPVYDLFYRVIKEVGASPQPTAPTKYYNAFDLKQLIDATQGDSLFFRIRYARSYNKDTTQINWASSDVYRYGIK